MRTRDEVIQLAEEWLEDIETEIDADIVIRELLALLDGGERPEPVAWRIMRDGVPWMLCGGPEERDRVMADVADDAEIYEAAGTTFEIVPLYASPVGRTPVSEGEERYTLEEIQHCLAVADATWDSRDEMRGFWDLFVDALRAPHTPGGTDNE